MNDRITSRLAFAACFGILASCTPSTNVPGTELFLEAPDGDYHGPMETLRLEPQATSIEVAESTLVSLFGTFEDGTEIDVSAKIAPPNIFYGIEGDGATLGDLEGGKVYVVGTAEGTPAVTAQLGTLKTALSLAIIPASLRTMEVTGSESVARGGVGQLVVVGTYGDQTTADLTSQVTYTSSDETVATVSDGGIVVGIEVGQATITAEKDGITATYDVSVVCAYPGDAPALVRLGQTLPNMSWTNAVFPNNEHKPFVMEDVYCQREGYEGIRTLFFQISAEWCGPCRTYRRQFNSQKSLFDSNASQFIVTELVDTQNVANVTSEHANMSIRQEVDADWGISLGDLDTAPTQNLFGQSDLVSEWPTFMIVRTRDMKVIATSRGELGLFLDNLETILQNPDWDWSDLANPVEQFVNNCAPGEEEIMEPNDTSATAKELGVGSIQGGICTEAPDYYRVNIPGRWKATLAHDVSVGNLDFYLWNESAGEPMMNGNFPVGGYGNEDVETFEATGPGLIKVEGKGTASAGYRLYIQEL